MTIIDYIFAGVFSFLVGICFVPIIIWVARKFNIIDKPNLERKIHKKNTPLLGGLAIYLTVNIVTAVYYFFSSTLVYKNLLPKHLLGVAIGGLIIMIGGFLDDKYDLKPKFQLLFPALAIVAVIISGIGIDWITNPMNSSELVRLDTYKLNVLWFQGLPYRLTLLADFFTLIWLMMMVYTTKLLDGLDGLVGSVTLIGGVFIFINALMSKNPQVDVALITIIFVGAVLAFLLYNFNPAKIFQGEGGSLYAGFMLGVLSIISGSKVSITLIIMGIPLLDMLWTIIRRLLEGRNPLSSSDKKHLHHRLLGVGFSVRQSVLILAGISLVLGVSAIVLQQFSFGLMIVGLMVLIIFILLTGILYKIISEKSDSKLD